MSGFECHLTFPIEQADRVERSAVNGWTFSKIEGDPVLGAKPYCYLTAHDVNLEAMVKRMRETVNYCYIVSLTVLREKIEVIIHDRRNPNG